MLLRVNRVAHFISPFKKIFRQIVLSEPLLDPNLACAGSFEAQRGHLTPKLGVFGVIWVKIQTFSNLDKLYTEMKLLVP